MRSSRPIPGNPWPHDMVLTITDDADALLELLWVREAWGLRPPGTDLPPRPELLPAIVPSMEGLRRDKQAWEDGWAELWFGAVRHVAQPTDDDELEALHASRLGSPERSALLDRLTGPSWRGRFGGAVFDEAYRAWVESLASERTTARRRSPSEDPERSNLDVLVPAWHRGLQHLIPVPCVGTYTRTVGDTALLLTRETRADRERYREALHEFAR